MKLKHCWWMKPKVLVVFICIVSFLDFKLVNKSVEIWSPVLGSSLSVCMWCLPSDSTIFMVSAGEYLLSWVTHIRPCCQAWLRGPLTNPISLRTTGAWMLQSRASHTPGIPASPNMPGWPTGPGKPRGPRGPSIPSFDSAGWPGSPV